MTRVAFCADVHVGNHKRHGGEVVAGLNRRCREVIEVLGRAVDLANAEHCDGFVVLGDLFDTASPSPQMIAAVMDVLGGFDKQTWLVVGNHEQVSMAPGDHALGPLEEGGVAWVIDAPSIVSVSRDVDIVLVPFVKDARTSLIPTLRTLIGGRQPLMIGLHAGIEDDRTQHFLRGSPGAVDLRDLVGLMTETGVPAVFSGDWHTHRNWDLHDGDWAMRVTQLGALCPTGWDNEGTSYGCLAIWDSEDPAVCSLRTIPGPRFIKVTSEASLREWCGPQIDRAKMPRVYIDFVAQRDQFAAAAAAVEEAVKAGSIAGGGARADSVAVEEAAARAAKAARGEDTLDAALVAFVNEMTLPDGATREEVVACARRYLAGGGA
jgi:hypothetical protein